MEGGCEWRTINILHCVLTSSLYSVGEVIADLMANFVRVVSFSPLGRCLVLVICLKFIYWFIISGFD